MASPLEQETEPKKYKYVKPFDMKGSFQWLIHRYCCIVSICNVLLLILILVIYLMGIREASFSDKESEINKIQSLIIYDWAIQPFVELKTVDGDCPPEFEPVFTREWGGTE